MGTRILILILGLLLAVFHTATCWAVPPNVFPVATWQRDIAVSWWRGGSTIDLDFQNNRYYYNNSGSYATYAGGTPYSSIASFISAAGATMSHSPFTVTTSYFLTNALEGFNSRASSGTYFDSSGNLQTASMNVARTNAYIYNGSSWVNSGTLVEPTVLNTIHANDGTGATASTSITPLSVTSATSVGSTVAFKTGIANTLASSNVIIMSGCSQSVYNGPFIVASKITGGGSSTYTYTIPTSFSGSATGCSYTAFTVGTLPTNWTASSISGVAVSAYAGTGSSTESGVYYEDVQIVGTPATSGTITLYLDSANNSNSAASLGQTWTLSSYLELSAGSLTNVTSLNLDLFGYTGNTLTCDAGSTNFTPTGAGLSTQRYSDTVTFSASTGTSNPNCTGMTRERPAINIVLNGSPVNFTLRVGMPQSEKSPAATSVIQDSGSPTTRSADMVDVGTYFDNTGTMQNAVSNTARLDYLPNSYPGNYISGGTAPIESMGYLTEQTSTNGIRNNLMVGAVAGTPGTLPTNWSYNANGTGIAANVIGTGTENGIPYIDVQFTGTAGANGYPTLNFETTNAYAVTYTNPYTASFYFKLQAGSDVWNNDCFAACTYVGMQGYNSGGTTSSDHVQTFVVPGNFSGIPPQTLSYMRATTGGQNPFADSTTAYVVPYFSIKVDSSNSVNVTFRIGLPQIENVAFATSVIPTSGAAVTRSSDQITIPVSTWYSSTGSTVIATGTTPGFDDSSAQRFWQFDDGTNSNLIAMAISTGNYQEKVAATTAGTTSPNHSFGVLGIAYVQNQSAVTWETTSGGDLQAAVNAGNAFTATTSMPTGITTYYIGSGRQGNFLTGWLQRITYMPTHQPANSLIDFTN